VDTRATAIPRLYTERNKYVLSFIAGRTPCLREPYRPASPLPRRRHYIRGDPRTARCGLPAYSRYLTQEPDPGAGERIRTADLPFTRSTAGFHGQVLALTDGPVSCAGPGVQPLAIGAYPVHVQRLQHVGVHHTGKAQGVRASPSPLPGRLPGRLGVIPRPASGYPPRLPSGSAGHGPWQETYSSSRRAAAHHVGLMPVCDSLDCHQDIPS